MIRKIPQSIINIIQKLEAKGFEAFVVGGCVRDLVLSEVEGSSGGPKDWDVTTNAKPEEVMKIILPDSFYENKFGTVGVKTDEWRCRSYDLSN